MTTEKALDNELALAYCTIKFDGKNASEDLIKDLISVEVEQSLYLPAMVTIHFFNRDLKWFESNEFKIGSTLSVGMSQDKTSVTDVITEAEIVALELDAAPLGLPTMTIRGYSKMHRLHRERKTRSFLNVSDSDVLGTLAGEAGLSANAESTGQVFDYIFQNNETNFEFLQRRVRWIGMELFTEGSKLKLRKPTVSSGKSATLTWGTNLMHFTSRLSAHSQIDSVTVRGWDPKTKKEIVGQASSSTHHPSIGDNSDGGAVAKKAFGGAAKSYAVYQSVIDQTQAQHLAQAIQDDINSRFIQIEANALGDPKIEVGKPVEIKGIGSKNSGTYYVTSCSHRYDAQGYRTWVEANGRQTHTFQELVGAGGDHAGVTNDRVYGPIIGLVSNNKDTEGKMNRVKVKLPALGDNVESNWARVVTPMTGNGYGAQYIPEINDEVLVFFENGNVNYPYIIGGLWNGKDKPVKDSSEVVGGDGKVNQRIFKSRSGHIVTYDDSEDKTSISVIDKTGNNKIIIDTIKNTITIESDADINLLATKGTITLDAKEIEMKASQNIKSTATQNIEMKATQDIKAEATQNVEMKATMDFKIEATLAASLKGTASAKVEGLAVDIKGSATGTFDGGGVTTVKGGVVKIN